MHLTHCTLMCVCLSKERLNCAHVVYCALTYSVCASEERFELCTRRTLYTLCASKEGLTLRSAF